MTMLTQYGVQHSMNVRITTKVMTTVLTLAFDTPRVEWVRGATTLSGRDLFRPFFLALSDLSDRSTAFLKDAFVQIVTTMAPYRQVCRIVGIM
jgi:hypothetical protein